MSGWFAVKRGTLDHELFQPIGKWSRYEAWVWLIENAAYKDTVIDIGGKPYTVPRGSLCFSHRFLSEKFKWSKKSVTAFLDRLKSHGVIEITVAKTGNGTRSKRTQVTLCNYDKYQQSGSKTEPKGVQKGAKEEQVTNIPPTEGASADPVKVMFDSGVSLLGQAGIPVARARPILGKWRQKHGTEAVIAALGNAQREGAVDPVSFIEGCFKRVVANRSEVPSVGTVKTFPNGKTKQYAGVGVGWIQVHA